MSVETKPPASDATLKVVGALGVEDVARGRVRVPMRVRAEKGWVVGDAVFVEGPKGVAGAIIWKWNGEEPAEEVVAMDGIMRESVGVSISDSVKLVHPASAPVATRVRLVPLLEDEVVFPDSVYEHTRLVLNKRPVARGEKLVVPGIAVEGKAVVWHVVDTEPAAAVIVAAESTQVEVVRPPRQFRMLGVSQEEGAWRLWFYAVGDKQPRNLPLTDEQVVALKREGLTEFEEETKQE